MAILVVFEGLSRDLDQVHNLHSQSEPEPDAGYTLDQQSRLHQRLADEFTQNVLACHLWNLSSPKPPTICRSYRPPPSRLMSSPLSSYRMPFRAGRGEQAGWTVLQSSAITKTDHVHRLPTLGSLRTSPPLRHFPPALRRGLDCNGARGNAMQENGRRSQHQALAVLDESLKIGEGSFRP